MSALSLTAIATILLGVLAIMITVIIRKKHKGNAPASNAPVSVSAQVSNKRYDYVNGAIKHLVTFNVNGKSIELLVSESQFSAMNDGDRGMLTYAGNTFMNFYRA